MHAIAIDDKRLMVIMMIYAVLIEVSLNGDRKTRKKFEFELDKA